MAATRELVSYFVPDSGAEPVVNKALAVFPAAATAGPARTATAGETGPATTGARIWDNEQGFFLPAPAPARAQAPASPPRRQTHQQPQQQELRQRNRQKRARKTSLAVSPESTPQRPVQQRKGRADGVAPAATVALAATPESSPVSKRFAGSTFEAASPDPNSLPIPKFSLLSAKTRPLQLEAEPLPVATPPANPVAPMPADEQMSLALTANELATTDLRRLLRI